MLTYEKKQKTHLWGIEEHSSGCGRHGAAAGAGRGYLTRGGGGKRGSTARWRRRSPAAETAYGGATAAASGGRGGRQRQRRPRRGHHPSASSSASSHHPTPPSSVITDQGATPTVTTRGKLGFVGVGLLRNEWKWKWKCCSAVWIDVPFDRTAPTLPRLHR